ncbi:MAG: hypothetical protein R3B58_03360 [Phycisphaerales bacterium]
MMVGGESRLVVGRATPPEFGPPNDTSFGYLDECEFVPFENAPTMKLSRAMTIANENGTDVMYVLGDYPTTGSANTVLRFDGQTWSQMPSLITGNANAICSATVAGQQRLVAAGNFQFATFSQPPNLNGVAYFNGSAWQPLGEGHAGEAFACIPFDGPFGPTVLIGGDITSASGFAFGNIGFWNGFGWQPLGNGVSGIVHALAEFDDGQGPQVYVGGSFTVETPTGTATNLARWNGTDFEPLPVPNGTVRALDVANDGTTTSLYISGTFTMIDGNEMPGLVRFQNNALESVGGGVWQHQSNGQYNGTTVRVVSGSQNSTSGISVFAEKFYVDDQFTKGYATFDGAGWDSCYSGVSGGAHNVVQIGDDLWIASRFEDPPIRDTCEELAILTPNGWVDPGLSLDNRVDAIYEYPADSGTVYVGGRFQSFSTPSYLIKHENDQWSGLGDEPDGSVLAITSGSVGGFDRLYIGGAFTHVGTFGTRIAQWNGLFWDTLGPGLNSGVTSMVILG